MALTHIGANGLRNLETFNLNLSPRSNLITGPNGAGKTSVLESIYFLSRGRSFRTHRLDKVRQHGADALQLVGMVEHQDRTRHLGITKTRSNTELTLDKKRVQRTSDLTRLLPVLSISSETHRLIEDGPEVRRRFLDWGVFHVEPDMLSTVTAYRHALAQRNAALRLDRPTKEARLWDDALIEHGARYTLLRTELVEALSPLFEQQLALTTERDDLRISLTYNDGFSSSADSLANALEASFPSDRQRHFTHCGPHRAGLILKSNGRAVKENLSRGQQKMLSATLVLALADLVQSRQSQQVTLLIDDLPAELDADNRQRLFKAAGKVGSQLVITAINAGDFASAGLSVERMFHVEQGTLASL